MIWKADVDALFDQFWQVYPLHRGKGQARRAFAKSLKLTSLDVILTALRCQIADRERCRAQADSWVPQWPYPATWLNGERWTDEPFQAPPEAPARGPRVSAADVEQRRGTDEMKRLIREEHLSVDEAAKRVGY